MGFIKEFKDFAATGNFVDLAVGVVMGAAVGKVVSAFIDGMVMPIVGMISGKDFSNLYFGLNDATKTAAASGTVSVGRCAKIRTCVCLWQFHFSICYLFINRISCIYCS